MSKQVFFENFVDYDSYFKNNYIDKGHNIDDYNISTLLFKDDERSVSHMAVYTKVFDIKEYININTVCASMETANGGYRFIIQPDVVELSKAFPLVELEEIYFAKDKLEFIDVRGRINNGIETLTNEIILFISGRDTFLKFPGQRMHIKRNMQNIFPFSEDVNNELSEVFDKIANLKLPDVLHTDDYYSSEWVSNYGWVDEKNGRERKEISVPGFINYKSFKDFLKNYCLMDGEYLSIKDREDQIKRDIKRNEEERDFSSGGKVMYYQDKIDILEEELQRFYKDIDFINNSESFTKENLMRIYLDMDLLIQKENAIDEFVNKVILGDLNIVEFVNSKVRYIRKQKYQI